MTKQLEALIPVYGFGFNDFPGVVSFLSGKRRFNIKSYQVWRDMIKRCYDKKEQQKRKHYQGCKVCDEWKSFSAFKEWWDLNHVDGWHLDKDLLVPGNKVYSPSTCVFIPQELNTFTTAGNVKKNGLPAGASKSKFKKKFDSYINVNGKRKHLGSFDDAVSAHLEWHKQKTLLAGKFKDVCDQIHPALFSGLIGRIDSMKEAL
ncbi:hypothetical protein [Cedecea sp. P7760]|uniref:hypothetical protein n=1 Tax=Cedecea sp. P7760 TaxID=2726983 RepID=UPI0015A1FA5B|nr:hypothetical protein [Cedecea sp. P7760]NWC63693.1 hypothetical protein [Cedecea sp. P7760]